MMTISITMRRAAATALLFTLVWAVTMTLGATPGHAQENGNPPSVECASSQYNGNYWKLQINNGAPGDIETNLSDSAVTYSISGGQITLTNNTTQTIFRVVFKTGNGAFDATYEVDIDEGESQTFDLPDRLSHITVCFTGTGETTTTAGETTTTAEETTTTAEQTTTTAAETTTTTAPSTTVIDDSSTTINDTTTTGGETTTTAGTTTSSGALPTTTIVGGTTTTGDNTTSTSEAGTTSSTGGSGPTSTVAATSTTVPAVTASTLPFTGSELGLTGLIGLITLAAGGMILVGMRGRRPVEEGVTLGPWSTD